VNTKENATEIVQLCPVAAGTLVTTPKGAHRQLLALALMDDGSVRFIILDRTPGDERPILLD
jgi:hypothetical protein